MTAREILHFASFFSSLSSLIPVFVAHAKRHLLILGSFSCRLLLEHAERRRRGGNEKTAKAIVHDEAAAIKADF
jgi:hypothetical protein